MTTPQFLNMVAVENKISLADHQAMAARFPNADYLTPDEIQHRQSLIAAGHDPKDVHSQPRSVEHRVAHGLGATSLAVNVIEGNAVGAALDAGGMAAESETVQKAAARAATKMGVTEAFELAAKRIPVVGAGVTVGFVLFASGKHAWAGDYDLAAAELAAGGAEAVGNIAGFGAGDAAREIARQGLIAAGGDRMAAVEKSGVRQLGESAYEIGRDALTAASMVGKPVSEVLPPSHASMAQGADMMGERGEVSRIAIERTGLAANDPANNMAILSQEAARPRSHILVLEDGSVQGPESGGVAFGNNPQIAAGKNGNTLGVMYAGTGAMNDAQWNTVQQISTWLGDQRQREGLSSNVEMIAGSTTTAELLKLPTPRGPLPTAADLQVSLAPVQSRMRIQNTM